MPDSAHRPSTDSRAVNAAAMVQMALGSRDPLRRAQYLADAQRQLGLALYSVFAECEEAGKTWAQIGDAVQMPRETAFRQYTARGPIAVMRATHTRREEQDMIEALYAFEAEDGIWYGPSSACGPGHFTSAILPFNPANPNNRFAGQMLRARFAPWTADEVSVHAPQVRLTDGSERRVRATDEVIDLLFNESGQSALRRALIAAYYAVVGNKSVEDHQLQYVVGKVFDVTKSNVPEDELLGSALEILETDRATTRLDGPARTALNRLGRVVQDYLSGTREIW